MGGFYKDLEVKRCQRGAFKIIVTNWQSSIIREVKWKLTKTE